MHWLRERGIKYAVAPFSGSSFVDVGVGPDDHQTTWCAQKAINFIEANASSDRPWLFSVNIYDPHHPFDPPEECLERYADRLDDIPLPNFAPGELDAKPSFQRIDHEGAYGRKAGYQYGRMTDTDHRWVRAAYWAMCDLIDDQVGRMLDALERTAQTESTIVIFMSDHGELLGDHGMYLKGPHFYEPAIRVPLLVSWPGHVSPGVSLGSLVELVDVAPTLLDAAGLPPHPGMQGASLLPSLMGAVGPDPGADDVYCEYYNAMPWHEQPNAQATMLRTAGHKIVMFHGARADDVGGELYDLDVDPLERHNRWSDPAYSATKCELIERLCDRMAWTADPLPPRLAMW
jgi:arylsulfatase A-like enzyme